MYDARSRYVAAAVQTASPARLLTMLADRLVLDVERAAQALAEDRRVDATQHLAHAQDIVAELAASLDVQEWDGGPQLLSIYTWLLRELLAVSSGGDAVRLDGCRQIVAELARTWHDAADVAAAPAPADPPTAAPSGLLGVG
ncbi:flagellar protein FliS [Cellulomonas sp. zg-ZUI222]|uniref:flagellar export chaperone FliS n=1 Tax=Cellulomonas TaxID=1707 RepID=UPI001A9490C3|nr:MULTISPECIES: flagellar export chaperone FliS [Cellulomonas]MBO0901281.1 flagellar protein FliS [Cellulomonas sp. zg-ZUI22]MBO0922410.1 flagellar protein FliS [Cellulomonas wangleii]